MLRIQQRTFSTARTLCQTSSKKPLFQNPKVVTTDDNKVKIEPIKRTGEDLFTKRQRLTYQSRKRGILETDLLLSRFSKKYLTTFNEDELNQYDTLLDELDWDIYYWATRNYDVTPLPEKYKDSSVLKLLQEFSENKERVVMRMPDLDGTGH